MVKRCRVSFFSTCNKRKNVSCIFERFDANLTVQTPSEWERTNIGSPYTDFDCNHYKRPTKERSSKVAELRDTMRLTREIDLVKANEITARDVGNDFISDESYIQYYNSSLDSYIAEQTEINTNVYRLVVYGSESILQVISLILNSNQSYH